MGEWVGGWLGIYEQGPLLYTASVMPHPISSLLFLSGLFGGDLVDLVDVF